MKQLPPLYTLAHGIEVVGDYPAKGRNRYARLRIRPHRFFPGVPVVANGIYVRKSRVLLAAKLGRALLPNEHAHHGDKDRTNDVEGNIESISPADHNKHHKTGFKHSQETKDRIAATLREAYASGRKSPSNGATKK
jgi:hypothetical protein